MPDPCAPIREHRRTLLLAASASIVSFGLLAAWSEHGNAQAMCMSRDKLVEFLEERHSEKQVGAGLETGGRLFEIFAAANGSTWTMVVTTPNGASCVIATGLKWQEAATYMPAPKT